MKKLGVEDVIKRLRGDRETLLAVVTLAEMFSRRRRKKRVTRVKHSLTR